MVSFRTLYVPDSSLRLLRRRRVKEQSQKEERQEEAGSSSDPEDIQVEEEGDEHGERENRERRRGLADEEETSKKIGRLFTQVSRILSGQKNQFEQKQKGKVVFVGDREKLPIPLQYTTESGEQAWHRADVLKKNGRRHAKLIQAGHQIGRNFRQDTAQGPRHFWAH